MPIELHELVAQWLCENNINYATHDIISGVKKQTNSSFKVFTTALAYKGHRISRVIMVSDCTITLCSNHKRVGPMHGDPNVKLVVQAHDPHLFDKLEEYIYETPEMQDSCKQVRDEKGP